MALYPFQEAHRIRKKREFERVYAEGARIPMGPALIYALGREDDVRRLGITVSRKIKGSVRRNRIKRVIREVFRTNSHLINGGCDMVVVGREGVERLNYWQMRELFLRAIKRINTEKNLAEVATHND